MKQFAVLLLLTGAAFGQRTTHPCTVPSAYEMMYLGASPQGILSWLRLNTATGQVWQTSYPQLSSATSQRALNTVPVTDGASGRFTLMTESLPSVGNGQNVMLLDSWTGAAWLLSPDKLSNYSAVAVPDAH